MFEIPRKEGFDLLDVEREVSVNPPLDGLQLGCVGINADHVRCVIFPFRTGGECVPRGVWGGNTQSRLLTYIGS